MRGGRPIEQRGRQVADVEVDRESEQEELKRRNADDHREGQPIAAELHELLPHDGEEATEVHAASSSGFAFRVEATKTSSRFGATGSICASGSRACTRSPSQSPASLRRSV